MHSGSGVRHHRPLQLTAPGTYRAGGGREQGAYRGHTEVPRRRDGPPRHRPCTRRGAGTSVCRPQQRDKDRVQGGGVAVRTSLVQ